MKYTLEKGKRIAAGVLDGVITAVAAAVLMYGAAGIWKRGMLDFAVFFPVVYFLYELASDCLAGRTLGKLAVGAVVSGPKGKTPSTIDFVIRAIVKTMPLLLIALFPKLWWLTVILAAGYVAAMLLQGEGKALHDLVGNTEVRAEAPEKEAPKKEVVEERIPEKVQEEAQEEISEEAPQKEIPKEEASEEEAPEEEEELVGLLALSGEYCGAFFPLEGEALVLGRDYSCNVIFSPDAPEISRRHCKAAYDRERQVWYLTDLNSTFGTYLGDGSKLPSGSTVTLQRETEFYIGKRERFLLR